MNQLNRVNNRVAMLKVIKLLLIDDDSLDQRQVERAFSQKGILLNMHTFADAEKALQVLIDEEPSAYPDIVLLDVNMPRMNGIEFLSEIRKHEKFSNLKIFILSNSDQDKPDCEALGISGFIQKPLKFNSPSMDTITLMIDMMNA